jgi:hypothetical protein
MSKTAIFLVIGVIALLAVGFFWTAGSGDRGPIDAGQASFLSREIFQLIVSVLLLSASLFVILSTKYGPKDKHWAYATVGTLVGFWFRS